MIFIFLNVDLAKIEEAVRIEDKDEEYQNITSNERKQNDEQYKKI